MSVEIIENSIPRKLIRIGVLTRDAIFYKGSMSANIMLNAKEIEQLPYTYMSSNLDEVRGILFIVNQDKMAVDLLNNGYEYPVMNITEDLREQQKKHNNLAVADNYSMDSLLEYLGFPEQITIKGLQVLSKLLTSKRQIQQLALPCAYGKINVRLTNTLDYQQELKLNGDYYKFIGEKISEHERCVFDKIVPNNLKQVIFPAAIFEILVKNQGLGYSAVTKSACSKTKKFIKKRINYW